MEDYWLKYGKAIFTIPIKEKVSCHDYIKAAFSKSSKTAVMASELSDNFIGSLFHLKYLYFGSETGDI